MTNIIPNYRDNYDPGSGGGGGGPSYIIQDTFTDTNGVALTSHTPDLQPSTGWVLGSANADLEIQSNELVSTTTTVAQHYAFIDSTLSDGTFEIDLKSRPSGSWGGGLAFRAAGSANYWAFSWSSTGEVSLYRVAGSFSLKANNVISAPSPSTWYRFRAICNGSSIICRLYSGAEFDNLLQELSTTSTDHISQTGIGPRFYYDGAPYLAPSAWDNLTASTSTAS